jgi:hypothetical protein
MSDFDFDCDVFDSLLAFSKGFLDFVKTHWAEFSARRPLSKFNHSTQTSDLSSLLLNPPPVGRQENSTRNYHKT